MNELELIVQRMIDAGEPENNIAAVIKEYNSTAGKITPTIPGAVVEETAAPEIQPTVTESPSVDISLDLPQIENKFKQGEFTKEQRPAFEEYQKTGKINQKLIPIPKKTDDRFGFLGSIGLSFQKIPLNVIKQTDNLRTFLLDPVVQLSNPSMTNQERKEFIEKMPSAFGLASPGIGISGSVDVSEKSKQIIKNIENKQMETAEKSLSVAFEKGNYVDSAFLAADAAIQSLPSIAFSLAGPGAIFVHGSLIAGEKYADEMEQSPNSTAEAIGYNALATGALEAGSDLLFRGLLTNAGVIAKQGTASQAKEYLSNGLGKIVKKLLIGPGEASTEVVQNVATKYLDELILGREFKFSEIKNELIDDGVVGWLMGSGTSMVSSMAGSNKAQRSYAEGLLMPEEIKQKLNEYSENYNFIAEQYSLEENEEAKNVLEQQLASMEREISNMSRKYKTALYAMDNNQTSEYSKNKDEVLKLKNSLDKTTTEQGKKLILDKINNLEKSNNEILKEASTQARKKKTAVVTEIAKSFDNLNVNSFSTDEEGSASEKIEKILTKAKVDGAKSEAFGNDGTIIRYTNEKGEVVREDILINEDVAKETESVNVAAHELLHAVLTKTLFKKGKNAINLGEALIEEIQNIDIQKINDSDLQSRILNYADLPKEQQYEEVLNLFSDAIATGDIRYDEGVFTKIGDFTRRVLQDLGWVKIKFNTGRDVYNFIKDYNRGIEKGVLSRKFVEQAKAGFKGKLITQKRKSPKKTKPVSETFTAPSKSKDLKKQFDSFVQDDSGNRKYKTKKEFENSPEYFEAYQAIIEPNASLDAEISKGTAEAGIFDQALQNFISEVKENLAMRFVKNFDPAKNESLFGWMMGKTPVLQKAKLDVIAKFKKSKALETQIEIQKGGKIITRDVVSEDLSIEDQIDLNMQNSKLNSNLIEPLEALTSDENIIEAFKNTVKETLPTNIEELKKINYKNLKDYAPKITSQIFGKKTKDKQQFIKNNAEKIYALLPLGAMKKAVGLKTSTGIQRTLLDNFYQKGERQKMAEGTAAGLNIQEKLPFNKNNFLEVFGANEGQPQNRNQVTAIKALEAEIGKAITNRTVRKALNEAGVEDGIISTISDGKAETMASRKLRPILFNVSPLNLKYINFKNVDQVSSGRKAIIKLSEAIGVENTMKYLLPTIQRGYGTLASGYIPNKQDMELFQVFKKGNENDSDQIKGRVRQFLFLGRKDFFDALNYFTDNKIEYVLGSKEVTWNSNIIETTKVLPQNTKGFTKGEKLANRVEFAEDQRKGLEVIVNTLRNLYNKKQISKNDVGMIMATLNSSVDALVRTAAIPGLQFKIDGLADGEYRYEHTKTASDVLAELTKYILDPNYSSFENIISDYRVAIIPKEYDAAINKVHTSDGPRDLKNNLIKGEGTNVARYNSKEVLVEFKKAKLKPLKITDNLEAVSMASKSLNKEFNTILEQSSGIKATKKFSPVEARIAGKGKGKFKFFIPYSADDFVGLLYTTLAGGKTGDQQMDWYRENLLRPFSRGIQQYEAAKQNALREWQILKKEAKKSVPGGLDKKNASGLTNQEAVRLYIWKQQGMEIPGTKGSAAFVNENLKTVRKNPELKAFAERLMALNPEGYPAPSENWDSGDITTDLVSYIDGVKRSEFLTEFKDNVAKIFSDSNKEKLRALYGDNFIEALDDMLHRMKTGTNRRFGASKIERQFMDWTNNSVGAIMFFNTRSAVLQTLSAVNFINFTDNNPINAAIAFGNFPQYVKDFSTLFNSDFLKQRRTGLQTDVNADEIARAAKGSKNTARAILSALLKFGFTPTQIADSFAIASGGATFYRNRINKYKKEGLSQQEAEQKAFTDFQEIAEETQQSARPDRISLQQASSLGRLILAFGNTPMQYARLTKKATLDLINGRGDWKTNMSKIMYYSVIQNIIFSALQQGLFALLFDDEDDDKEKSRLFRIGNSSLDTFLRGSGVYGAAAATAKNMILKVIEESEKSRPDYTKVAIEATAISPPINSKLRKLVSAGKTFTYKQSKEKVFTEGFSLENPAFLAGGQIISALTNLPADRIVQKADHIYTAMQPETELWQSTALSLGWSEWDLNMIEKQTKKPEIKYKTSKSRTRPQRKTR